MEPAALENYLIEIGYFPEGGKDNYNEFAGTHCVHKITEEKEYVQITINDKDGSESYRRPVFIFEELVADLKKNKKI